MTYQEQFLNNRYAQIATQIGHAQRKPASWMHATAATLCEMDAARAKGPMTDDHLKQTAVRLARNP